MECQEEKEQIAYPLFYDVEPSDIRYQSGPVGRAIAKYKTNGQIKEWEKALEGAGNLVGWDLKNLANGYNFLHHSSAKLFYFYYVVLI